MILDIHTHMPAPKPDAVICATPEEILALRSEFPEQRWSVGYHPWNIPAQGLSAARMEALAQVAALQEVVAIGETGIDRTRIADVPLFAQINALRAHIRVAAGVGKPLVLHAVQAQNILPEYGPLKIGEEGRGIPAMIIHGFRQKPSVAKMYLDAGFCLSFGEHFNPDSLLATPPDRIFAETDESRLSITDIITLLHDANPAVSPAQLQANIENLKI